MPQTGSICIKIIKVWKFWKFDSIKFEGVQFEDKGAFLIVRDLHHEGDGSKINQGLTFKAIIRSFVKLEAHGMQTYATQLIGKSLTTSTMKWTYEGCGT